MEHMSFSEVLFPRLGGRSFAQATIEGEVPLPTDRTVRSILSCNGKALLGGAEVTADSVLMDGSVELEMLCEDESGELYAFTAASPFSYRVDCMGAKPSMSATVQIELLALNAQMNGEVVALSALADIMCRVEDKTQLHLITRTAPPSDTEFKLLNTEYKTRITCGTLTVKLREEIATSPEIEACICARATAVVRDVTVIHDYARIDGLLFFSGLCANSTGGVIAISQSIPFSADVNTDGNTDLFGTVEVLSVSARTLGEEFGLLCVEAIIDTTIYYEETHEISLPLDAFSPSKPFECKKMPVSMLLSRGRIEQRAVFHDTITLPESAYPISRAVSIEVRPIITAAQKEGLVGDNGHRAAILVDGIAFVTLIYEDERGTLRSVTDEMSFSADLNIPYENTELDAVAVCIGTSIGAVNGGSVDFMYTLHITADVYELADTELVEDITPCGGEKRMGGITVCFAGEGETRYDIAKRLSVSQSLLLELNPQMPEVLCEGDKIICMS